MHTSNPVGSGEQLAVDSDDVICESEWGVMTAHRRVMEGFRREVVLRLGLKDSQNLDL